MARAEFKRRIKFSRTDEGREWHISRSFGPDRFAPECGCPVAACGHVIASTVRDGCPEHGWSVERWPVAKTLRSFHRAFMCPEWETTDGE